MDPEARVKSLNVDSVSPLTQHLHKHHGAKMTFPLVLLWRRASKGVFHIHVYNVNCNEDRMELDANSRLFTIVYLRLEKMATQITTSFDNCAS